MSWVNKENSPKIKREQGSRRANMPEGLWHKCSACEAVLYATDLESNLQVCPKCGHHHRLSARARLEVLLDADGRSEIGAEVGPTPQTGMRPRRSHSTMLLL